MHTKTLYFVYVWGAPVKLIVMIFGTARDLTNVIYRAKVCIDRFKIFRFTAGESWGLS